MKLTKNAVELLLKQLGSVWHKAFSAQNKPTKLKLEDIADIISSIILSEHGIAGNKRKSDFSYGTPYFFRVVGSDVVYKKFIIANGAFGIKNSKTNYVIARCRNFGEMDRASIAKSTDFSDVNGSLTNYRDNAILDTHKCNVQTPVVAGVSRANKGGKGNTSACNCIKWTNNPADTVLTKNKTT